MEIEFSPSQMSGPMATSPLKGRQTPATPDQAPSLEGMAELQKKLNDLALTRPEKMGQLKMAASDLKYPPDALLNGIAHLLAIHFTD